MVSAEAAAPPAPLPDASSPISLGPYFETFVDADGRLTLGLLYRPCTVCCSLGNDMEAVQLAAAKMCCCRFFFSPAKASNQGCFATLGRDLQRSYQVCSCG